MIAQSVVAEVRRLLSETPLSQRKIAALTGISRGTVSAIAAGRRRDFEAIQSQDSNEWEEPAGPLERCGGCGGMVYMPCRLCAAREQLAKRPRRLRSRWQFSGRREGSGVASSTAHNEPPLLDDALRLDLRPEHQARYEEVCNWRRENGVAEADDRVIASHGFAAAPATIGTISACQGACP